MLHQVYLFKMLIVGFSILMIGKTKNYGAVIIFAVLAFLMLFSIGFNDVDYTPIKKVNHTEDHIVFENQTDTHPSDLGWHEYLYENHSVILNYDIVNYTEITGEPVGDKNDIIYLTLFLIAYIIILVVDKWPGGKK